MKRVIRSQLQRRPKVVLSEQKSNLKTIKVMSCDQGIRQGKIICLAQFRHKTTQRQVFPNPAET